TLAKRCDRQRATSESGHHNQRAPFIRFENSSEDTGPSIVLFFDRMNSNLAMRPKCQIGAARGGVQLRYRPLAAQLKPGCHYDAKPCFTAHHACVSFRGALEWKNLSHGPPTS